MSARVLMLFGIGCVLAATGAMAQIDSPPPSISIQKSPALGTLLRGEERSIDYNDDAAAVVVVTGEAGRDVQIGIVTEPLLGRESMITVKLAPQDVAYSTDNGMTWRSFVRPDLTVITRFPSNGVSATSSILVRIGASIKAGRRQQRGEYRGKMSIEVAYIQH